MYKRKTIPLMTTAEVATRLNVSPSTVRQWVAKENWDNIPKPTCRIGNGLRWEFAQLEAFINGYQVDYPTAKKEELPESFGDYMN